MAVGKAEILDSIANMTVLELSQLIKEMEEKFGVSAAAVAVASATPAAVNTDEAPSSIRNIPLRTAIPLVAAV